MVWFEYLATKSKLPKKIDVVKSGYIFDKKGEKVAERRLKKRFSEVLIVRRC